MFSERTTARILGFSLGLVFFLIPIIALYVSVKVGDETPASDRLSALVEIPAEKEMKAVPAGDGQAVEAFVGLDAYSVHMDKVAFNDFRQQLEGSFIGIGVRARALPEGIEILELVPGGPAAQAGIRVGDVITAWGGERTQGWSLQAFFNSVRENFGRAVSCVIARAGMPPGYCRLEVRRVLLPSVVNVGMPLEDVGYLRIRYFHHETAREFERALRELESEPMQLLVVDLQGNPGGLLDSALQVAGIFAERGTVLMRCLDAHSRESQEYVASGAKRVHDYALVVLVDGGTSSAAEVLAGCWQQLGIAEVFGSRTFGKGSIQRVVPVAGGEGVKYTAAYYALPDGTRIDSVGIEPDLRLPIYATQIEMLRSVMESIRLSQP